MFKPFDMTSMASIISVNENTFLKFVETDAPFYSKLELYHEDSVVSDCSFKPEESKLIKNSMQNSDQLIQALEGLNCKLNNVHLSNFIALIDSYKEQGVQSSINMSIK